MRSVLLALGGLLMAVLRLGVGVAGLGLRRLGDPIVRLVLVVGLLGLGLAILLLAVLGDLEVPAWVHVALIVLNAALFVDSVRRVWSHGR